MITLALPLLARWAALKAIGWSGAGAWLRHRAAGLAGGSWVWAIIAVSVMIGGLVVWRWLDPPERSYTAAEVRANRLAGEVAMLQRAAADHAAIIAGRDLALSSAVAAAEQMEKVNAEHRAHAPNPATVVFADDDPWLQSKRQRAPGGRGAGPDRR